MGLLNRPTGPDWLKFGPKLGQIGPKQSIF